MGLLPKRALFRRFELAIQDAGARLLYRSPQGRQPASYTIVQSDQRVSRVLVYIWNMTHGGGAARPVHEYRIQVTGISSFQAVPTEKTLILGWSEDFEVFAGFDCRHHSGALGASPSMQISADALRAAQIRGFAPNSKGNGETAIAFRPDFAAAYVEHLTALHDTGGVPSEAAILERISQDPIGVPDADIDAAVAPLRRVDIVQTRRAVRDAQFRKRILSAYGNRCAICGVQLRLLDAAHVLPVEQPGSTDDTSNGIALCALHHRAYDRALVAFDPAYNIHVNAKQLAELASRSLAGGLQQFQAALKPSILLPADQRDYPRKSLIAAANRARGWSG
jgi:putative restriction endonuclease